MKQRIKVILLIFLSIGILFPFYLLRRFSPAFKTEFDWLFHSDISHIVARIIFYGILSLLASSVFSNKKRLISLFIVFLLALGIALSQETIQLLTGQGPLGWDDGFDVLVDMTGAIVGLFIFRLIR
jgi:VanZ family protein